MEVAHEQCRGCFVGIPRSVSTCAHASAIGFCDLKTLLTRTDGVRSRVFIHALPFASGARVLMIQTNVVALSFSLLALGGTLGCGGAAVGCDFRTGSVNGPEDRCQERAGVDAEAFRGACEGLQGEVAEGGCPEAGRVLGCVISDTPLSTTTNWYYVPMERATADQRCEGESGSPQEP